MSKTKMSGLLTLAGITCTLSSMRTQLETREAQARKQHEIEATQLASALDAMAQVMALKLLHSSMSSARERQLTKEFDRAVRGLRRAR